MEEPEFEFEFRGPIVDIGYSTNGNPNIEIHHEWYEFEDPKTRRFRIYETGQTISAGEYYETIRAPGMPTRHIYELK